MSSDGSFPADSSRRFTRFGLASLFVLTAAVALAIAIGMELSKSEVTAYIQVSRLTAPPGWSQEWFPTTSEKDYETFRQTQLELMRSKSLLTRAVRSPSISLNTFLARTHDPVEWLEKNLKIDYPGGGELLRVRLLTHESDDGVNIVNAVIHTYFREVVEKEIKDRNQTEQKLKTMADDLAERSIRERKDVQNLATALGADAAARSAELEQRHLRIKLLEEKYADVQRQVMRLELEKNAPQRVRLLDEASVSP